jgi:hypothetical protein
VVAQRIIRSGNDQLLIRFGNGYGMSIVRGPWSYGGPEGLYEVAVGKFAGEGDDWDLCYDTPITDDVIGWLNESDLPGLAERIAELPPHLAEVR